MDVIVKDIINAMEGLAPQALAEDWDTVGLGIGDPNQKVKRILVALDVIPSVIDEGIRMKADMIITHHPMLLFQKINHIRKDTYLGEKIYKLIENQISIFSAHTNLDIVSGGVNDILANRIGLIDTEILEETFAEKLKKIVVFVPVTHLELVKQAMGDAGAGQIGKYSHATFQIKGQGEFMPQEGSVPYTGTVGQMEQVEEIRLETIVSKDKLSHVIEAMLSLHPYEEVAYDIYSLEQKGKREGIGRIGNLPTPMKFQDFAEILKEKLGISDIIRLVGDPEQEIKRIGLCGGSGVSCMEQAKAMGADLYVTGDLKYHEAQKAIEMGLCMADITHYASEVVVLPEIKRHLEALAKEKQWAIEIVISQVDGQTFWCNTNSN